MACLFWGTAPSELFLLGKELKSMCFCMCRTKYGSLDDAAFSTQTLGHYAPEEEGRCAQGSRSWQIQPTTVVEFGTFEYFRTSLKVGYSQSPARVLKQGCRSAPLLSKYCYCSYACFFVLPKSRCAWVRFLHLIDVVIVDALRMPTCTIVKHDQLCRLS